MDEFVLCVPSDSDDDGLVFFWDPVFFQEETHFSGGFEAVHLWHVEIDEDHTVGQTVSISFLQLVQGFKSGDTFIHLSFDVKSCLKHDSFHR